MLSLNRLPSIAKVMPPPGTIRLDGKQCAIFQFECHLFQGNHIRADIFCSDLHDVWLFAMCWARTTLNSNHGEYLIAIRAGVNHDFRVRSVISSSIDQYTDSIPASTNKSIQCGDRFIPTRVSCGGPYDFAFCGSLGNVTKRLHNIFTLKT
jgi:hypothetical protein